MQGWIAIRPYFGDAYFRKTLYLIMIKWEKICRCTLQEKKNSYEDTPMVDFDRGSVFYQLDIKEDRLNTKENILLTREIVVEDSIFGGKENRDNWNRAFA